MLYKKALTGQMSKINQEHLPVSAFTKYNSVILSHHLRLLLLMVFYWKALTQAWLKMLSGNRQQANPLVVMFQHKKLYKEVSVSTGAILSLNYPALKNFSVLQ